jgi:hypothetical protein
MVKSEVWVGVGSIDVGSGSGKRSVKGTSEVESEEEGSEGKSVKNDSGDMVIVSDIGNVVVTVIEPMVIPSIALISIWGVFVIVSSVTVVSVGS